MPVRLKVAVPTPAIGLDLASRRRSWLMSTYEDTVWYVDDSIGEGGRQRISYDVQMADGRSLLEHAQLYSSAKEIIFWIRAGNYTNINDALRHKQYADTVLRLCYGLTARGHKTFSSLTSIEIDAICEEAAFGIDGLTMASKIVKTELERYASWSAVPDNLKSGQTFSVKAVTSAFNLPPTWAKTEIASEVAVASARLDGKLIASVADAKVTPITVQNIQLVTQVFDALFSLRHFMDADTIRFRPFPEGPSQRAFDLGRTTDRTPVPPPELALGLIEGAVKHLVRNGDQVAVDFKAVLATRDGTGYDKSLFAELKQRIEAVMTSAYILIAAFTARRTEEIKMLQRECLAGNDGYGWWMKVYIEKTERRWSWMPVPSIVARAVRLVNAFQPEETRPDSEADFLFRYLNTTTRRLAPSNAEGEINSFARSVGSHEYANDNGPKIPWKWNTRQFRRFFAVMFFYRYRGKIQTLAHHLRHFDLRMTADYVTLDAENEAIWTREHYRFQVNIAKELVEGRRTYTGAMGERLNKLVGRVRKAFEGSVTIVSEKMALVLMRTMKKQSVVIEPKAWVTCTCSRDRAGCVKAACRKVAGFGPNDVGPDFASAGPTVCPDCPFALFSEENLGFIEEELGAIEVGFAMDGQPSMFAELQAANVILLSAVRDRLKGAL